MSNLSVIIVNYKSWTPLKICLDSLLNQKKIKPKIIVLDNNSDDNKFIDFKSKYKSINWIKNQENYGFSKACNIGSNIAKTEDCDTTVSSSLTSQLECTDDDNLNVTINGSVIKTGADTIHAKNR